MSSIAFSSLTGINADSLSERARALLRDGDGPDYPEPAVPASGHAHVLLWTLLVMRVSRLRRFADHVGMLGAATELRHVLEGRRIAALREQLGDELYHFGMLKAPLIGRISATPAAFSDPGRVSAAVHETGMAALQAFCHSTNSQHAHLRARLSARLHEISPGCLPPSFVDPPSSALLQRVLREVEPVLASAFDGIGATP